jgi:KDO2-lipid IV(A) lauroyltransferase
VRNRNARTGRVRDAPPLRRVRFVAGYLVIRFFCALVGALPEGCAIWMGDTFGRLFGVVCVGWRHRATDNLRLAMPELDPPERRRTLAAMFRHFGISIAERMWSFRRLDDHYATERLPIENLGRLRELKNAGTGVLVVTLHFGNWELLGACASLKLGGINALARPQRNPLIRNYVARWRDRTGLRHLSTEDGLRPVVRALRSGDVVALLLDQHVGSAAVSTTFFGRPVVTSGAVAALAARLRVPILIAYAVRQGFTFRHRGYWEGPLELVHSGDRQADMEANTQRINDRLEAIIRQAPEQWLWMMRRWRTGPQPARRPAPAPEPVAAGDGS